MAKIKENISYAVSLSATFTTNLLKVYLIGIASTLLALVIGLFAMRNQGQQLAPDSGFWSAVYAYIGLHPIVTTLFGISIIASPFIIIAFANKHAIAKCLSKVISGKADAIVTPMLTKGFEQVKKLQPNIVANYADFSWATLKTIAAIKESDHHRITKQLVAYGLNKIEMGDVDFSKEGLTFEEVIKTKLLNKLNDLSATPIKLFWLFVLIQWIVVLAIHFI